MEFTEVEELDESNNEEENANVDKRRQCEQKV